MYSFAIISLKTAYFDQQFKGIPIHEIHTDRNLFNSL